MKNGKEVEKAFSTYSLEVEKDFLVRLEHLKGDMNASAFARKCEIPQSSMNKYLKGSMPGADKAAKIADACGASLEWLITGRGEQKAVNDARASYGGAPDYVVVAHGIGSTLHKAPDVDPVAFSRAWIEREGLDAESLALVQAPCDDMAPTIRPGDLLLVDLRGNIAGADGIYAIKSPFGPVIKRVQTQCDGSIYIRSDNDACQPERLNPDQAKQVTIIGRVVWVARRI